MRYSKCLHLIMLLSHKVRSVVAASSHAPTSRHAVSHTTTRRHRLSLASLKAKYCPDVNERRLRIAKSQAPETSVTQTDASRQRQLRSHKKHAAHHTRAVTASFGGRHLLLSHLRMGTRGFMNSNHKPQRHPQPETRCINISDFQPRPRKQKMPNLYVQFVEL